MRASCRCNKQESEGREREKEALPHVYEEAPGYRPTPRVRDRERDAYVCILDGRLRLTPSPPSACVRDEVASLVFCVILRRLPSALRHAETKPTQLPTRGQSIKGENVVGDLGRRYGAAKEGEEKAPSHRHSAGVAPRVGNNTTNPPRKTETRAQTLRTNPPRKTKTRSLAAHPRIHRVVLASREQGTDAPSW